MDNLINKRESGLLEAQKIYGKEVEEALRAHLSIMGEELYIWLADLYEPRHCTCNSFDKDGNRVCLLKKDENGNPIYCSEKLIKHTESGEFNGSAFDIGTASFYEQLYFKITEGKEMTVTPEMAAKVISVIEFAHAENPLPVKF